MNHMLHEIPSADGAVELLPILNHTESIIMCLQPGH